MDVLRLDRNTFYPDALVEGYDSLIWTERYLPAGEFEIKTPLIEKTLSIIPEGSLITLRDSEEVMFVESHTITKSADGFPELTTKGRTFESFLENRTMSGLGSEPFRFQKKYTPYEAAEVYLYENLVNSATLEVTRASYGHDYRVKIPRLLISRGVHTFRTRQYFYVNPGPVYPQLIDMLDGGGCGIKTIRPDGSGCVNISVSTAGSISANTKPTNTYLQVNVYEGVNRSLDQSSNSPVIFDYKSGDIEKPKYLFSIQNLKTQLTLMYETMIINYYADKDGVEYGTIDNEGLDKRMMWVAGGDMPPGNTDDWYPAIREKMKVDLKKHQNPLIFDGEISTTTSYKYKEDYDLGDLVSLVAEYGVNQSMMVSEYIRTEDSDGESGYPTLVKLV